MGAIDEIEISVPPPFEMQKTESLFDSRGVYATSGTMLYGVVTPARYQIIYQNAQETSFYVQNMMSSDIERFLKTYFSEQKISHYRVLNKFEVHPVWIEASEPTPESGVSSLPSNYTDAKKPVHIIVAWQNDSKRFEWTYKNPDYRIPDKVRENPNQKSCASCRKSKTQNSRHENTHNHLEKPRKQSLILNKMIKRLDAFNKELHPIRNKVNEYPETLAPNTEIQLQK